VVSADGLFLSCSYIDGGECTRLNSSKITNTLDNNYSNDLNNDGKIDTQENHSTVS